MNKTLKLTVAAMLVALGVALQFCQVSIPLGGLLLKQVGVHLLAFYISVFLLGPLTGCAVGIVMDVLGTLFNPAGGAYNPAFAVTYVVAAVAIWLVCSVIFKNCKHEPLKIIITVFIVQALIFLPLNTLWLQLFYIPKAYGVLLVSRAVSLIFELPVYSILLCLLTPFVRKLYTKKLVDTQK